MEQQTPKPTDGVKVSIGGREFTLRYTLGAMKRAKEHFGGSIASRETLDRIEVEDLGKLLWFGTQAEHPEVTVDDLDNLISADQRPYLLRQYLAAMGATVPDPNGEGSPQEIMRQLNDLLTRAEAMQARMQEMTSTGSPSGPSDGTTSASVTPIFGT